MSTHSKKRRKDRRWHERRGLEQGPDFSKIKLRVPSADAIAQALAEGCFECGRDLDLPTASALARPVICTCGAVHRACQLVDGSWDWELADG